MLYDFHSYLARIDSSQKYSIQTLTGGIVNVTVRANKNNHDTGGLFPEHESIILKYAPPFVAARGKSLPISTYRQTIEARALSLFLPDDPISFYSITSKSSVQVPTLLHHDLHEHVLIMSDFGSLPNLSELFSDLGGYSAAHSAPDLKQSSKNLLGSKSLEYVSTIGTRFGSFLAHLHSPKSLSKLLNDHGRGETYLKNPELGSFAFDNGIKPIEQRLLLFPQILSAEEAKSLYQRAAADNLRETQDLERSLILADCWPGSLLFDLSSSKENKTATAVVLDWEFATIGRGINNDLAQLLAHLALFHTTAQHRGEHRYEIELLTIARAMMRSYRRISEEESAPWTETCWKISERAFPLLDPKALRTKMLRSAFLTHGIEIMRCSFGKIWRCDNEQCMKEGSHPADKHECILIQAMVQRAIWYFRHAGVDAEDFCSQTNVLALTQARDDG